MKFRSEHIFRILAGIAITVPILFVSSSASAQQRLKTPVKMKIEDGNFDQVSVIIKNTTTNETNSVEGSSKFDLELKMNCNYVISFTKPGYITKKIALNTTVPEHRMNQGFYPFPFEVNLFQQYDGVNIVVFNQPVGKIAYSRMIDDFDYDTDYTKQIQSMLKAAEEEILQKQKEARLKEEQRKRDEENRQAEELAKAKEEEKARKEAEKKAAEEARLQAIEEQKQKKAEEEQRKLEAQAVLEEEKRQQAVAKIEEEERKKLAAAEEEERRRSAATGSGEENPPGIAGGTGGDDGRSNAMASAESENRPANPEMNSGDEARKGKAGTGGGDDGVKEKTATKTEGADKGIKMAIPTVGEEKREERVKAEPVTSQVAVKEEPEYEKLPDLSVEEIKEANRVITRVTVRNGQIETVFSKVVYDWGGVYYFRSNLSISESLYRLRTGMK